MLVTLPRKGLEINNISCDLMDHVKIFSMYDIVFWCWGLITLMTSYTCTLYIPSLVSDQ